MTATATTIRFFQDEDHENPITECDWDGMDFYYGHRNYDLGGTRFHSKDEMDAILEDREGDHVFPVYMYDHSGCTVSLSPFNDPWDSGIVGFIIVDASKHEYDDAHHYASGMVADLDTWLHGDIWSYVIEDGEEDIIDCCGGFFGDDIKTNGMLEHIDEDLHDMAIAAWEDRF